MAKKAKHGARHAVGRPTNPRLAAVAELDRLLWEHERRALADWQVEPPLRETAELIGPRLFDELVNRIWTPEERIRSSVVWALGILAGREVIPKLWEIVRTGHRSTRARLGALEALERMGISPQPGQVPADLLERIGLAGRRGLRTILAEIEQAETPADVENALLPLLQLAYGSTAEEIDKGLTTTLSYVYLALQRGGRSDADFLTALAATTPVRVVRLETERAVSLLRGRGAVAASPAVVALHDQRFYRAYALPVPQQPAQTQVLVAWMRGENAIRNFTFTIDVEEWHGGIRAFDATDDLTETAFRKRFIEEAWLAGTPPREIALEEARQRVSDAIRANARLQIPLPPEYLVFQPLIDRYLLEVSASQPE